MKKPPIRRRADKATRATNTSIAEQVTKTILARKLKPGERLGEQELADVYGVSRTLVREALTQLQSRGFVEVRPRIGWYIVEPSFEDARQTYAARRIIESGMLRDAPKIPSSAIKTLRRHVANERKAIRCSDAGSRSVLLADFHVCLAECLGNRQLTSMIVDLSTRTTLASALYQSTTDAQDSKDDHAAIVSALGVGDTAKAEELMRAHIDFLAARLDERLANSGNSRDRLHAALALPNNASEKKPRKARLV